MYLLLVIVFILGIFLDRVFERFFILWPYFVGIPVFVSRIAGFTGIREGRRFIVLALGGRLIAFSFFSFQG